MSDPRTLTEAEVLAMMDESDADIEAGRLVPGEVVAARIQAALERYEAEQRGDTRPRNASRR